MPNTTSFDASASAVGYIYQVRYALLLALQKIYTAEDPDDCAISIEKIDDISFHENGSPNELLQSKYHSTPGNLTDRSPDIWKTIRIWTDFVQNHPDIEEVAFTLITTEKPQTGSLARMLSSVENGRDVSKALVIMRNIAEETSNKKNLSGYRAFKELTETQQRKLVSSIHVLGDAELINDAAMAIKKYLRTTVEAEHIDTFLTRLEGAWFSRVISLLKEPQFAAVSLSELVATIDDLRTQFLPTNLPADYEDAIPEVIDIDGDHRVFVEQLRLIEAPSRSIKRAIINYYRAYEQRSRWSRDNLLKPGEIQRYLNRLKDEWEQHLAEEEMKMTSEDSISDHKLGRAVYNACQSPGAIPIRSSFEAKYVARGSYEDLADKRIIGWHPDYEAKLSSQSRGAA